MSEICMHNQASFYRRISTGLSSDLNRPAPYHQPGIFDPIIFYRGFTFSFFSLKYPSISVPIFLKTLILVIKFKIDSC